MSPKKKTALDREIEQTEVLLQQAQNSVQEINTDLDALYVRRSKRDHNIDVGDRVRGRGGAEGIVDSIRPDRFAGAKPWLYVRRLKKDGEPGNQITTFFDWEKVGA